MPSFWSSFFRDLSNIVTAWFTSRCKPSILDIRAINYRQQCLIVFDHRQNLCKVVGLHQLKSKDLNSLDQFCQQNEPSVGPQSNCSEFYDTNEFPATWPDLLKRHYYQWNRQSQPETSSAQPSRIDQSPLAQNQPPEDHETRMPTEVESKRSIDFGLYEQGLRLSI